jgi:hypothetical protein
LVKVEKVNVKKGIDTVKKDRLIRGTFSSSNPRPRIRISARTKVGRPSTRRHPPVKNN